MRAGVPQGSILGPTLFILYTNDAEDHLPPGMDLAAYADDTTLFNFITSRVSIPGSSAIMQQGVDALSRWGVEWKIKFEPSKTQAMTIAHHRQPWQLPGTTFDATPVSEAGRLKLLGVTFDSQLTYCKYTNFRQLFNFDYIRHRPKTPKKADENFHSICRTIPCPLYPTPKINRRRNVKNREVPKFCSAEILYINFTVCAAHTHDPLQSTATPRLPAEGLCYPRAPWPTPSLQWVCPPCAGVLSPGLAWCATRTLGQARPDPATSHPHHRIGLLAPSSISAADSGLACILVQAILPGCGQPANRA